MNRIVLILGLVAVAHGQSAPDPEAVLARFRAGMLGNLVNQPDYTCLETVERTRQAPGGALQMQDTLRLEVALVNGREMFSWPGAKEFEDRDLRDLVPTGMFGNGNYGIYARILFGGGGPPFKYRDTIKLDGATALRYDYGVPRSRSGYTLRNGDVSGIAGFHGSIYLDPMSADLRRLEVIADEIPPELQLKAAEDRIDYVRAKIGDEEFLLPKESSLLMASADNTSRNRVRFSGCRKFSGESSLIFEDEEFTEAAKVAAVEVTLPAGLTLSLELDDLLLEKAAGGDPITAKVNSGIKRDKETLVPKGALAKGRIVRYEKYGNTGLIQLRFTDLEWTGAHAALNLDFDDLIWLGSRGRVAAASEGEILLKLPAPPNLRGVIVRYRTLP